ncbi:MAG: hypothetical protein C4527_26520 [Candidatus Omnitrophota bacterium]|jgi:hypothetical protein|nr:MAG: hypothetical protein C4527_26520 [Candidatus Omnitrophota bacterium]
MRAAADDVETVFQVFHHGAAFQEGAELFHQLGRPVSEIEESAFPDLVPHAIGFAQKNAGGRIAIANGFDVHDYIIALLDSAKEHFEEKFMQI